MTILTVILLDLLTGMEFDLFTPSFPEIQTQYHLSTASTEALLSINFIAYCFSMFFVGPLSDRYGRRPIVLGRLILFITGTLFCLNNSYTFLLCGRFIQGLGIAAPAILSFLIVSDLYDMKSQQFWMAILNGFMNAATALGPVLGSYITMYYHWQGNFTALLATSAIAFILSLAYITKCKKLPTNPTPVLKGYSQIIQDKTLIKLLSYIVCMFVPYWIFAGMSPILYIEDLGVSLSHFGYYQGTFALIFSLGSFFFGLALHRLDPIKSLRFGLYCFIFSIITLSATFYSHSPLYITLSLLPFIIGQIMPSTLLYPLYLNYIPELKGQLSSLVQGLRLIICAISLQIASYLYQANFQTIDFMIILFIAIVVVLQYKLVNNEAIHTELLNINS